MAKNKIIVTQELVKILYKEIAEDMKVFGYKLPKKMPEILFSSAKRNLGVVEFIKCSGYRITLSRYIKTRQDLKNLLAHEMLHMTPCQNFGLHLLPHGKLWSERAGAMNDVFGYRIEEYFEHEDPLNYFNYVFVCEKLSCSGYIGFQRKCKKMSEIEKYRCSLCGGQFIQVK